MKDKDSKDDDVVLDPEQIWKDVFEENNFVMKLVDSIPASMYFNTGIVDKITAKKHAVMDKVAEEMKRKSFNHVELSAKNKHKRARLDPSQQKSVSQIQEEINRKKRKKKAKGIDASASLTRAANIEELQKRLQEKINSFQAQRKVIGKDAIKMNRLKNKVKKLKVKQKGNMVKVAALSEKKAVAENGISPSDKQSTISKPIYNKDGDIIYGKFDFADDDEVEGKKKSQFSGKNLSTLLKNAEKAKEKIETLKSTDPEKAELLVEKDKWTKAILRTEGVKVKDDPQLLKKSIKRQELKKHKSSKAWNNRIQDIEKKQKDRQEKRTKNIQKRKQEKRDRKIKLAKKKGRVVLDS